MQNKGNFTEGKILQPLLKFAFPVFLAMFLQSMYGAVDLLVVGQFAQAQEVSAVATGSQIMLTLTSVTASFSMGITVVIGQMIGKGDRERSGQVVGSGIWLFGTIGLVLSVLVPLLAVPLSGVMNAPPEAFSATVSYVRICGAGMIVIIAYNLIGSIFRGLGDSKTPLISVAIACLFNILGDLLLVAVFRMGAMGAALATVLAQLISVLLSLLLIRRKTLPFTPARGMIRFEKQPIKRIIKIGWPVALQDLLVSISFMVALAVVNRLGVVASAGVGVAEKVCGFLMLVPSAFGQSMSAFVAQNVGAGKLQRARRALLCAIAASLVAAVAMFWLAFFHGDLLSSLFARDEAVLAASFDYLKAYGIDCLLTCFLFCFIGYFNGMGMTRFVMVQGLIGAFCVRVPLCILFSSLQPVSLFRIGLATPSSTVVQILLCLVWFAVTMRRTGSGEGHAKKA